MENPAPDRNRFPLNAKVRFTQDRLSVLMPPDRKRLEGRMGVVQGYWNYTRKPIVYFPQDGNRSDLRLLRVDPRHLELVEASSCETDIKPLPNAVANSDAKLSQDDTDALFG